MATKTIQKGLNKRIWWEYLHQDLRELLQQSMFLVEVVEKWRGDPSASSGRKRFHDYAFVVFPAAKAYEGFLKNLFFGFRVYNERGLLWKTFQDRESFKPGA